MSSTQQEEHSQQGRATSTEPVREGETEQMRAPQSQFGGTHSQIGEIQSRMMRGLVGETSPQFSSSSAIEPNVEFEQRLKEQVQEGKGPEEIQREQRGGGVKIETTSPEELAARRQQQQQTYTGQNVMERPPKQVHFIEQRPGEAIYIKQQPSFYYQSQLYPGYGRGAQGVQDPTINLFNRLVAKDTHCLLGRTGVKVSRVCLGTMNFGKIDPQFGDRPEQLDEDEAHTILDRFVELGGNCIDTADFFPWFGSSCGESETIVGNWLEKQERERIFIVTKVRLPTDADNVNSGGLSRSHLIDSVNKSLKRLRTSYIDLLLINGWDPTVSVFETVRHLDDLVRQEKVRYIGVCDFKGWQLQKFVDAARVLNLHKCVCYEGEYNLLTRGCEWEVVDVCRNERIGFFAYSPFKYGFITDKYTSGTTQPVEGTRIEAASRKPNLVSMAEPFEEMRSNPLYVNLLEVCEKISKKRSITTSQIAILWALQKGFVTSVVCGVNNVRELEENMACLTGDITLTRDELVELDQATRFRLQYPYTMHLSSLAGYREIDPRWAVSFEQLSFMNESMPVEQMDQMRLGARETLHESRTQSLPEQEYLKQPHTRAGEQQIKQDFPQYSQPQSQVSYHGLD